MKPTKDDIRRRLGLREVPKPPDDLVRRLKADIPPSFRYTNHAAAGRKGDASSTALRGMSWQVAASFLVLTLGGVGIYMVMYETEQRETARIAEADKAPEVEFSPPTSPPAAAPATEAPKLKKSDSPSTFAYEIPAPPPPPPPSRQTRGDERAAQTVEGRAEGGVEGGVIGGVAGGVPGGVLGGVVGGVAENEVAASAGVALADADDARRQPAEPQVSGGRDHAFAEEKGITTRASAPATAAAPAEVAAKDEKVNGVYREPALEPPASQTESVQLLRARAAAGETLRVGGAVKAPVVVERVEIAYPKRAKEAGIQGIVIIETVIDRQGRVKSAKVLKPLSMGLDEAALRAVKQWKFKPATLEGEPVEVRFVLTVNAKLSR
ncbi:MAG: energy transducer TonB [Acidobacteria bacterium]|nr:energy transducer TonB [Acidobacteriota bacterium]